jgi:putative acetyltransferase
MDIRQDDLSGPAIIALLQEHLDDMHCITPAGSVHALDLAGLRMPAITFWSAWREQELLGCAALKELDSRSGEIKSMRTARPHRGKGVAAALLRHIIGVAAQRQYQVLKLETGSFPAFAPARSLYLRHGFEFCGPFAGYRDDPNSVYMELMLPSTVKPSDAGNSQPESVTKMLR